jgi:hypothetical protein
LLEARLGNPILDVHILDSFKILIGGRPEHIAASLDS